MKRGEDVCQEAADFASGVGRDRLVNISHSEGIATVWYWGDESDAG